MLLTQTLDFASHGTANNWVGKFIGGDGNVKMRLDAMGLMSKLSLSGLVVVCAQVSAAIETPANSQQVRGRSEIINKFTSGRRPKTRSLRSRSLTRSIKPARSDKCNEAMARLKEESLRENAAKKRKEDRLKVLMSNSMRSAAARTRSAATRKVVEDCAKSKPKLDFVILFELGSDRINQAALPQLQEIGEALESNQLANAKFIIAGHTDARGGEIMNMALSKARAISVKEFLMDNYRVRGNSLQVVGYGYSRLKVKSDPYSHLNRRVGFIRVD